jgi:ornithine cyclodeaminase
MNIRILGPLDVEAALSFDEAIDAVQEAFSQFSANQATVPLRTCLVTEKGQTLVMPAYLHRRRWMAVKIVSVYPGNARLGFPTVPGLVLVIDPNTGMPKAMMDGHSLTAIRTGAAGALATRILAKKDAQNVVLFGAGTQGWAQIRGVLAVRDIRRVWIVDPNRVFSENLAQRIRALDKAPDVTIPEDAQAVLPEAQIVITATTSCVPVFDGKRIQPGTHITAVGAFRKDMQEVDADTVNRALVVVDSRDACMAEAGDIVQANARIHAEIGEIINGKAIGRTSDEEITLFKSVGLAAQDAAAAAVVLQRAEALGLGKIVSI